MNSMPTSSANPPAASAGPDSVGAGTALPPETDAGAGTALPATTGTASSALPPGPAAAALAEYRRKRDFALTAEPAGADVDPAATPPERPAFVVQKHAASSLHYDFRLELGGVLKSWAVPKGPSLDPTDKRLAVMTEDHPLEYATFEGSIPKDEYGGGTVMVWDFGWWEPDLAWMKKAKGGGPTDPEAALAAGELKFIVHGEKLAGSWALVQMKNRGEKNWLLLKHRDDAARPASNIISEAPDSVATGRSLEQIAADSIE